MEYDDLLISIERRGEPAEQRYQATAQQRGLLVQGGSFRRSQGETFSAAEVQEIRDAYARALEDLHTLGPMGMEVPPPDLTPLIDLGSRVAALLPVATRVSLRRSLGRARARQRGLRITLEVMPDAQALLAVPWELMALSLGLIQAEDPAIAASQTTLPLLLNADVAFVREVRGVGRDRAIRFTTPLQLQAFIAEPNDVDPIETESVQEALGPFLVAGSAALFDEAGTLPAMQERVRDYAPQIIHVLCHGQQVDTGRQFRNTLCFTHRGGYTQRVGVFDLVPTLSLARNLDLVILHACHSGAQRVETERAVSESIALGLLRYGVPVVIAFQGEVKQVAAGAFVETVYTGLTQGKSIDQVVAEGRIAMHATGDVSDWSLPVVYRGNERPEPATPFTRLGDRIGLMFTNRETQLAIRGGLVLVALVLIVSGVTHWLLLPPLPALFPPDQLQQMLVVSTAIGMICAPIMAATHRGVRRQRHLPPHVRRIALIWQWFSAFIGYGIAQALGLMLYVSLYWIGLLTLLPISIRLILFYGLIFAALLLTYTYMRIILKNMTSWEWPDKEIKWWNRSIWWLLPVGGIFIQAAPLALFMLSSPLDTSRVLPVVGSFVLAMILVTISIFNIR